jgi:hypothetical protein
MPVFVRAQELRELAESFAAATLQHEPRTEMSSGEA